MAQRPAQAVVARALLGRIGGIVLCQNRAAGDDREGASELVDQGQAALLRKDRPRRGDVAGHAQAGCVQAKRGVVRQAFARPGQRLRFDFLQGERRGRAHESELGRRALRRPRCGFCEVAQCVVIFTAQPFALRQRERTAGIGRAPVRHGQPGQPIPPCGVELCGAGLQMMDFRRRRTAPS